MIISIFLQLSTMIAVTLFCRLFNQPNLSIQWNSIPSYQVYQTDSTQRVIRAKTPCTVKKNTDTDDACAIFWNKCQNHITRKIHASQIALWGFKRLWNILLRVSLLYWAHDPAWALLQGKQKIWMAGVNSVVGWSHFCSMFADGYKN